VAAYVQRYRDPELSSRKRYLQATQYHAYHGPVYTLTWL